MKPPRIERKAWANWASLLTLLLALWVARGWWEQGRTVETVPYSGFEQLLRDGQIAEVQVGERFVSGTLRTPREGRTTVVALRVEPALAERLSHYGVPYRSVSESTGSAELNS